MPDSIKLKGGETKLLAAILLCLGTRLLWMILNKDSTLHHDEIQYYNIALSLLKGEGFSLDGKLTSFRPPLYPYFIFTIFHIFKTQSAFLIKFVQSLIGCMNVLLVYLIAKKMFNSRVGLISAFLLALYPSFVGYTNLLLTEIIFSFLITLFFYLFISFFGKENRILLLTAGLVLGAAALTRSIMYPFAVIAFLLLVFYSIPMLKKGLGSAFALILPFLLLTTPWVIRNTILQETLTFMDTNAGMNFLIGNYQYTPLNRPWEGMEQEKEKSVLHILPQSDDQTEGVRQKQAFKKALCFIAGNPILTLKRDIIKTMNFWGQERVLISHVKSGHYGYADLGSILLATFFIFLSYSLLLLSSIFGALFFDDKKINLFFIVLLLFFTLGHAISFGHPRFHLPLIPLLIVYASFGLVNIKNIWSQRRSKKFFVALSLCTIFIATWLREILFIDLARFFSNS